MKSSAAAGQDLVKLLAEKAECRATGILRAARRKHIRLICFEKGQITYLMSNVIEEQFDEFLVSGGLITPVQRAEAKLSAAREKKVLSAYLLEQSIVSPSALRRALEDHIRQLLLSTLEWPDGKYKFDKGRPKLEGEVVTRLSCVGLILEHTARHPKSIDEVKVRIGPPDIRPAPSNNAKLLLKGFALDGAPSFLIERCDGSMGLAEILEQSRMPRDDILRALHGLLLAGVLQPAQSEEKEAASKENGASRDECLARLLQAEGADHYNVLGVDNKASVAEIRDAYYFLARRFHPDRFRVGDMQDLILRVENYFTQVTEAYNTLTDSELRKSYDMELTERLGAKKEQPAQDKRQLARENYARARILLDKRRLQDAVTFLENAINLDDANATYHMELGRVLVLNPRRRDDSESHLQKALALDPSMTSAYMALGELYTKTGRKDQARSMFNEVLRWEPDNIKAAQQIKNL